MKVKLYKVLSISIQFTTKEGEEILYVKRVKKKSSFSQGSKMQQSLYLVVAYKMVKGEKGLLLKRWKEG